MPSGIAKITVNNGSDQIVHRVTTDVHRMTTDVDRPLLIGLVSVLCLS